jgi:hypothetical protein
VRDVTGKQHVIFIIDEVGQYIGSSKNHILNMDGLARTSNRSVMEKPGSSAQPSRPSQKMIPGHHSTLRIYTSSKTGFPFKSTWNPAISGKSATNEFWENPLPVKNCWQICLIKTERRCGTTPNFRMPNIMTRILTKRPLSTCIHFTGPF